MYWFYHDCFFFVWVNHKIFKDYCGFGYQFYLVKKLRNNEKNFKLRDKEIKRKLNLIFNKIVTYCSFDVTQKTNNHRNFKFLPNVYITIIFIIC